MSSAPLRFIALLLCLPISDAVASPLFESDSILQVSLTGPIATVIEAADDPIDSPFVMQAGNAEIPLQVQVRGKSRKRVCDFPPLRFTFDPETADGTIFAAQRKIKFVSHCNDNISAQIDVIEEYAVYKIFSLLSDASYRVRMLQIKYVETNGHSGDTDTDRFGFLIEPSSTLAARIGADKADTEGVLLSKLNARQAATVYVFQYLVGNTDWSLVMANEDNKCCHNGDLFTVGEEIHYVPYDFDMSGLVNARYAKPDPSLRISSVTQRRYRGYCIDKSILKDALVAIKARQSDILDVIRQLPVLAEDDKDKKIKYLESFFEQAENEDRLVKSFDRKCL